MSSPADPSLETQTAEPSETPRQAGQASLLVVDGGSSSRVLLPRDGVLVIGRAPEVDLRVDSTAVSRRHARLIVAAGEVSVADLGSHNGTRVNGERVEGTAPLASGDVVTVGETAFILRRERVTVRRPLLDPAQIRQRLAEEIERALDGGRPLAVLAVALGGARAGEVVDAARRAMRGVDIVGAETNSLLVTILPELGAAAARAMGADLLSAIAARAPSARGGVAAYPADGGDGETLLSAARAAAEIAPPGGVCLAAETAVEHALGDRAVLLADPAMLRLYDLIRRLAHSDLPVLVLGETGAGKENAAAAVHAWSPRAGKSLVTLNCAALPENLVESELFGYERGAFSEAKAAKPGLLERADGGTVFLDEVGELSLGTQAKLLRALEMKRITRLGDVREREVDFRVVAATNRDLEAEQKAGRFREDLLFRLSAAVVHLPPLRDRPREIPLLARRFLASARRPEGAPPRVLSDAAMARLCAYPFPGNVRELKNAMEYAAATAESEVVEPRNLPPRILARTGDEAPVDAPPVTPKPVPPEVSEAPGGAPRAFRPIGEELRDLERARMIEALDATGGVQTRAAELISMPIRTFVLKLKQYGISSREAKKRPG
ncbi:MAG: sigma 54-interacting transcriptional regulator [Byssovorax sp.]